MAARAPHRDPLAALCGARRHTTRPSAWRSPVASLLAVAALAVLGVAAGEADLAEAASHEDGETVALSADDWEEPDWETVGFSKDDAPRWVEDVSRDCGREGCVLKDSDADGLSDFEEVHTWHTDPFNADTDGDGISDFDEVRGGSDPLVADAGDRAIKDTFAFVE